MSLHKSKGSHGNLVLNKLIHQNGHADCESPPQGGKFGMRLTNEKPNLPRAA